MVDPTTKTKAAMLLELESIKGLLLEEDDIPILQEVEDIDQHLPESYATASPLITFGSQEIEPADRPGARPIVEEQQDFFNSSLNTAHVEPHTTNSDSELRDTIEELAKHTAEVTINKFAQDAHKSTTRPSLAKATGENPFLPAHIRSRLHGNNPPPLFAQETARKIASSSIPSRLLGNTFGLSQATKPVNHRQTIIDGLVEKFMPEIEKELREKLQTMTKEQLEELIP